MKGSYIQQHQAPRCSAERVSRSLLLLLACSGPAEWGFSSCACRVLVQEGEMLMRAVCTPVHRLASTLEASRHSNKVIVSEDFSSCYLFALLYPDRKPTRYCPYCWNLRIHINSCVLCSCGNKKETEKKVC